MPAFSLEYARSARGSTEKVPVQVLSRQSTSVGSSEPKPGPFRVRSAPMMPESSAAVTATVNVLTSVVPTTTFLPPLTTTSVRAVSPWPPSAWAAGTARADRARAPETATTVARRRMYFPMVVTIPAAFPPRPGA
ncbi:hypothetical protein GCM10010353_53210 [Streptomyces chryseus]|nr:hypothetical protein GCM10010353_53210 [Streptomyces chryseus]